MKKLAVLALGLAAILVGAVGPARAEGQRDLHSLLTPPIMARIMSVLTANGTAPQAQFEARALAFGYWLAGHADQLESQPMQTVEQGLADPSVSSAGQGQVVIEGGSGGGGNVPPCVGAYQETLKGCSSPWVWPKDACVHTALMTFITCLRSHCFVGLDGGQFAREAPQCLYDLGPSCKELVGMKVAVPQSGGEFHFFLRAWNGEQGGIPGCGGLIQVTVGVPGKVLLDVPLIDGQTVAQWFSVPANGFGGDFQILPVSIKVDMNADPPPDNCADYTWGCFVQCY